jgi:hypothetical protein
MAIAIWAPIVYRSKALGSLHDDIVGVRYGYPFSK